MNKTQLQFGYRKPSANRGGLARRLSALAMSLLLVCSLPLAAFAEEYDLAQGSVSIEAKADGQYVTQGETSKNDNTPVITQSNNETPTTNTITIKAEENTTANVTLDGVNIVTGGAAIQTSGDGNVTIELDGENTVQSGDMRAGVEKNNGGNLTITNTDEVTTDDPGSLSATGGRYGAGIGGGYDKDGSNITISGSAEVTATGGVSGAGIGGGWGRYGSDITVSGDAQVKAQGGVSYFDSRYTTSHGAGAAIGDGGGGALTSSDESSTLTGKEAKVTVDALEEGWIAKYAPGADMDSATPNSVTYKGETGVTTSENVTLVPEKAPTCIEEGHTAGFQCGNDQVSVETLQTVDHSYGDYTSDNNATCTSDGTKSRACIWCQESDPVTIPDPGTMLRHSFTNYVSNNDATYEQDGTKTAKCDHPGCDATDTIPDPGTRLPAPAFQVKGKDGKGVACETERKNGILTITVEEDSASLTGYLGGLQALSAQGIDTIVFVTNGVTSTFAVADLMAAMTAGDSYTLTHDGSTVTFTLATGTDISGILK